MATEENTKYMGQNSVPTLVKTDKKLPQEYFNDLQEAQNEVLKYSFVLEKKWSRHTMSQKMFQQASQACKDWKDKHEKYMKKK